MLKKFSLLVAALLVIAACGSADSASSTGGSTSTGGTTTSVTGIDQGSGVETALDIKVDVVGNSVSVFLLDSNGESCIESTNPECERFYFTWEGNFDDLTKNIDYGDPVVINDLNPGDQINFLLMYQEVVGAEPVIVKSYPFSYNG